MKRILILLLTIVSVNTYAQDQTKPAAGIDLQKIASGKKFKFTAKQANITPDVSRAGASVSSEATQNTQFPLADGTYSATLTPDSVSSYLPYYNKSKTVADGNASTTTLEEDPNRFSTAAYSYEVKEKKKGDINITIKPTDGSKVTKYTFDLSPDGTAKLEILVENYKIIKYTGVFTAL